MDSKIQIAFSSVDERIANTIPSNKEIKSSSYTYWGDKNNFPKFLFDCYQSCPTLSTIINGFTDYICGSKVTSTVQAKPNPTETWQEFLTHISADYVLYGVTYIQVIRNLKGEVSELYWLDAQYVRSDDDNETFWYNKKFGESYVKSSSTLIYPKFKKDIVEPSSVIAIKTPLGKGVYGSPMWISGLKSVITEIAIDDFHMSEIDNNFAASAIINFNNGVPSEEDKDNIERMIKKKFTGSHNAGNFLLSFNSGKANATTIERLATDDFDKRYVALATKTQKQIFTAFGVSPVVFGIERETTGFSGEDYHEAFLIFNKTKIEPIQNRLIDAIDRIFGVSGSLVIEPFSIDWTDNKVEEIIK